MSVVYRAKLYLGIPVDPNTFFFDEKGETVVLCSHPEAEGNNFCPVCGTAKENRTKVRFSLVVKPQFVKYAEQCENYIYDINVEGLTLHDLRAWDEDKPNYIFGRLLVKMEDYALEAKMLPLTELAAQTYQMELTLVSFDVMTKPSLYLTM